MQEHLVFDIETIPQAPQSLTQYQRDTIADKEASSEYWQKDKRKEMSLSPWFGRVISIGYYYPERDVCFSATMEDERALLKDFWNKIGTFNGLFVSYNGLAFDVPFIKTRSMIHDIAPTNQNFLQTRRYQSFPHFDVAQHVSDWDSRLRTSLEMCCDSLGIRSPKDGEIKASTVYDAYLQGRLKEIGDYCEKDLIATFEVYNKVRKYRV